MTTLITSTHNAQIKRIRRLLQRKERERSGLFLVEGVEALRPALGQPGRIELLVLAPELVSSEPCHVLLRQLQAAGVPCLTVSPAAFASLGARETARGVAAVLQQRWERLEWLRLGADDCWVVLESIQYPGNLGTILRTADAVRARGLILLEQTADPYDPAAVRASVGAVVSQRLIRTSIEEFAGWKRRRSALLIGTSPAAAVDYRQVGYERPLLLAFGSERAGLSGPLQSLCDLCVSIPMAGVGDSLNIAVAAGVVLYEASRCQLMELPADAR